MNVLYFQFHETPLHFACKYGSYEVVKLLLNNDLCTKTVLNKQNQIPFDMICLKYNKNDADKMKIKIKSLFEGNLKSWLVLKEIHNFCFRLLLCSNIS